MTIKSLKTAESVYLLSGLVLNLATTQSLELLEFADEIKLDVMPQEGNLGIVLGSRPIDPKLLTILRMAEVGFTFAKRKVNRELYPVSYTYKDTMLNSTQPSPALSVEVFKEIPVIEAADLPDYVMGQVLDKLGKLDAKHMAKLFSLLVKGGELQNSSVVMAANFGGMVVDFEAGDIQVGDAEYTCNPYVLVGETVVSGKAALFALASEIAKLGKSNMWKAKGTLSKVTGLWDKEVNYGVVPGDANLYMLNGCKALGFKSDNTRRFNGFPYLPLTNAPFAFGKVKRTAVLFTDKYAKTTLYGDDAANAAGLFGAVLKYESTKGNKRVIKSQSGQWTIHDTGASIKELDGIETLILSAKCLNRITQAMKSQSSDLAEEFENTLRSIRRASKFGTRIMSSGIDCMMEGAIAKTAMTNISACMGSGPAAVDPAYYFIYSVDKKIDSRANYNQVCGDLLAEYQSVVSPNHENFYMFLGDIQDVLDAIPKDKVFAPGEKICGFDYGNGVEKVLFSNDSHNQMFMVVGNRIITPKIDKDGRRPAYVKIELMIRAIKKTQYAKLRGLGIKAATVVNKTIQWFDDKGNAVGYPADIVFNNETRKGNASHLSMYANTVEGVKKAVVLGNDLGCFFEVTYDSGEVDLIDLTKADNKVWQWVQANTTVQTMRWSMPRYEYKQSLKAAASKGFDLTWKLVEQGAGFVVLEEECEVLVGNLPVNYEISTADESVGSSSLTPEMMAGITLFCPELAEQLYAEAKEDRAALFGLLSMATGDLSEDTVEINLQMPEELLEFQDTVGDLYGLSDREIANLMEELYPDGCEFITSGLEGEVRTLIYWDTVGSTMTFIKGSADQMSQDIISAIKYWADPVKCNNQNSGIDSTLNYMNLQLSGSLKAWMTQGLASNGIVKRMSRSSQALVNGKVRTTYDLELEPDADGLPKVLINPYCGIAKLLAKNPDHSWNEKYLKETMYGSKAEYLDNFAADYTACTKVQSFGTKDGYKVTYFDPRLLNGEIVGAFRIPMFMPAMAKIVVSLAIECSHVAILPSVWAKASEGDSDGDGIGLVNCSTRGISLKKALYVNASVAGMGGYEVVYKELPFADFIEKPKKKNLWQPDGVAYATFLPHDAEEEYAMNPSIASVGLYDIHQKTSDHYSYNVGTGYGLASAITCWAAIRSLQEGFDPDLMLNLEKGVALAWRLMYEGLGLSGYTAKAAEFYNVLRVVTWGCAYDKYAYCKLPSGKIVATFDDEAKAIKSPELDGTAYMLASLNLDDTWADAVEILVKFNYHRMGYSKLDRQALNYEKVNDDDLVKMVMVGAFRNMGRGYDPASKLELTTYEDGNYDMESYYDSCFKQLSNSQVHMAYIPEGTWLSKLYINGLDFIVRASGFLVDEAVTNAMYNQ